MGPYDYLGSLLLFMHPYLSLWVLVGLYPSLLVLLGRYSFL